ncbi:hypothetical protein PsYK624_077780 [Phanerochaete sordida]|uniref:RING-type domain-containing protein n=1 Tax=Phanerochaete sordida TaxID=48140 RepID=A0A9P3GB32_9APHY|nr:hypothetical protein PsYK624_077780 [Phanerochaete sordida]
MDQNDHAHSGLPEQSPRDPHHPPTPSGSPSQHYAPSSTIPLVPPPAHETLADGTASAPAGVDQPPPPYSADDLPSLPQTSPRNPRRVRVDDEEDEDDQRQTNRQRMHSPPQDSHHPSNDHHFHPDMHIHAQQHREQQHQHQLPQPGAQHAQRPPLPFNRISFTVDILPTFGAAPGAAAPHPPPPAPAGNPQQPAAGRAAPPPVFFELRFPFPPPAQAADGAQGQAAPHVHQTAQQDFANAFLQAIQMGGMPWGPFPGFAEEPEDPDRAKRLLSGLEQVPEGLVKRMERVGSMEGEQVVCAICFDSLVKSDDAESVEDKMEVEAESSPSPSSPSGSEQDVSEEEKKADEELDGKIVVLPCAHVFHASCLRPWFTRPHRTTCPTCRFDIDPDSLTYAPPTRRSRPRQPAAPQAGQAPANPQPQAQPQVGEPAAAPSTPDAANAAHPLPQPGAGTVPRLNLDGHDMPYILFDVSMLLPVHHPPRTPGQNGAQPGQPGQMQHPPMFGPPPPPMATLESQAGALRMARQQLEQLMSGLPVQLPPADGHANGNNQARPQPAAQPEAQPQAQPPQQPRAGQAGSRPFWQPFAHGLAPIGVHHGTAPQTNAGASGNGTGLGSIFANIFSRARGGQQQTGANTQQQPQPPQAAPAPAPQPQPQPQPQAAPAPAAQPPQQAHHHDHQPLPSFEEFMHLVGLGPQAQAQHGQPGQPQPPAAAAGTVPQQPPAAAAGALPQQLPHPHAQGHAHPHDGPFMDGVRDLATSVLEQLFPTGMFVPLPPRPANNGAAHPPPPPPGPIPFHIPSQPRAPQPTQKRKWTPPPAPGPTLRERVERKERELKLRCADVSCGLGPSDEDPLPVVDPRTIRQVALRPAKGQTDGRERVCEHTFHPACLVSAERVAGWSGADQKREVEDGEEEVQVSCPICRAVGVISREDWDEGACALA